LADTELLQTRVGAWHGTVGAVYDRAILLELMKYGAVVEGVNNWLG